MPALEEREREREGERGDGIRWSEDLGFLGRIRWGGFHPEKITKDPVLEGGRWG